MVAQGTPREGDPIGIVAGGGILPIELTQTLTRHEIPYFVAAIKGETMVEFDSAISHSFTWGEVGKILKFFKKNKCNKLVLLGEITKRPEFSSIIGDAGTMRLLPKILTAMTGGDDSLLRKVINLIESEGFTVVDIKSVAPELILEEGTFAGPKFPKKIAPDLDKALAALKDMAKHDIGQALVIENGRIIAVEGAEGTDAMLERIAKLRTIKRISQKSRNGFLVKIAKSGQDHRADLPTIGPTTVLNVAAAGLAGIVGEAGSVLLAEREKITELAQKHKIFLIGHKAE
ncbi:MAG: UDP-2,3-diacylglucosamine diphosphatase LpxI [Hyphomicrobiales bacterium]